jgi:hypothetical protein
MKRKGYLRIRRHGLDLKAPEMIVRPIVERPLQVLTETQLNALPDQFRCYSCQDMFPKEDIGGIELDQRLCKYCYPYLDDWWVGTIIKFDTQRRFPVEGD